MLEVAGARLFTHTAAQVPDAEVKVYRISDPVQGDHPDHFEEGVLHAPVVSDKVSWTKTPVMLQSNW